MAAATYRFRIEQGATLTRRLTWRDAAANPVDLTGYGARMQLRRPDGTLAIELSDVNGRVLLGGAAGTIDWLVPAADTAALPAETLSYDLFLTSPAGVVTRLVKGEATVEPRVTV